MKKWKLTIFLAAVLIVLCIASLFVGVLDMNVSGLVGGDSNQIETLLISPHCRGCSLFFALVSG